MRTKNLFIALVGVCIAMLGSCTTIETTLPKGEKGESAFELWVEGVKKGTIEWDKSAVTPADFFKYLKGKDGANGSDTFGQWKEYISAGTVDNPHKKGEKWDASRNTMQDFWYFLTGAKGENGNDGNDGSDGTNGKSAYEMWKEMAETGNLDNPHDKENKWDKTKVSEADFLSYLRGADAPKKIDVEKEVTKLTITKFEAVDGDNWRIEVLTNPNGEVKVANALFKQTATANAEGVAELIIERKEFVEQHLGVSATSEGRVHSETAIVTVPKAVGYLTPKYEETTQHISDFLKEEETREFIGDLAPINERAYNETEKRLDIWGDTLIIPVDFKGIINVEINRNDRLGIYGDDSYLTFDKENKRIILAPGYGNSHNSSYTELKSGENSSKGDITLGYTDNILFFNVVYPEGVKKSISIPVRYYSIYTTH